MDLTKAPEVILAGVDIASGKDTTMILVGGRRFGKTAEYLRQLHQLLAQAPDAVIAFGGPDGWRVEKPVQGDHTFEARNSK